MQGQGNTSPRAAGSRPENRTLSRRRTPGGASSELRRCCTAVRQQDETEEQEVKLESAKESAAGNAGRKCAVIEGKLAGAPGRPTGDSGGRGADVPQMITVSASTFKNTVLPSRCQDKARAGPRLHPTYKAV